MMKILLLNGVNMNMLGKRDPSLYGSDTLATLEQKVQQFAKTLGAEVVCAQSNIEGELVNILQQTDCDAVVLNAGAYSHYSYALRDCIECIGIPVIEVHMSNIYARETFRHTDVLADVCVANFVGRGIQGYFDAVEFLVNNHTTLQFIMDNL
ncbi:MAG: 3-dehydroquinate dehydratase [Clostridia bacterium]|nr:3-dehydroquinate dehydratase [Clostridia bacterium]